VARRALSQAAGLIFALLLTGVVATVTADDRFIRDCILTPDKTPVAGYPQIMPSFSGQISEEKVLRLIAYIKSLKSGSRT